MKKLSRHDYQEITLWMYRNARPIELALWQYHFENGSKEAVLSALSYYQNDDGGFGHGLEPDCWNPNSSPYTTLTALNILDSIELTDNQQPMIKAILNFLESNAYCSNDGWYFNIPSNNEYPHAPWWTFSMDDNAVESIGVTVELAAHIFQYADKASSLYKRAMTYTEAMIDKLRIKENYGDMGIIGYCKLLDSLEQANLTEFFDHTYLAERLHELVHNSIERDTSKWSHYSVRPSDYIWSPDSIFYTANEDIVSQELDYIIETRHKNGVWDITWSWFENNEKYAKEFAISENWWKATIAIANINLLKKFSRLDEEAPIS